MKFLIIVAALLGISLSFPRSKRAAYDLPDGAELLVGSIKTTFTCSTFGYYADVDNNCQVFHICNPIVHADGSEEMEHYSFVCGNQTVFNQVSMTCATVDEAIPCSSSADFYGLNERIGKIEADFLSDADVEKANTLIRARQ